MIRIVPIVVPVHNTHAYPTNLDHTPSKAHCLPYAYDPTNYKAGRKGKGGRDVSKSTRQMFAFCTSFPSLSATCDSTCSALPLVTSLSSFAPYHPPPSRRETLRRPAKSNPWDAQHTCATQSEN
ncbi:hypothetical protein CC78DRAFT_110846 [Lojkania enalia]|uniref:Uncharacterized protein n=1 Tax=Lojkania enalia TaxID=147567 RepID=A0A9P4KE30_9PLEO|nr:hypothetical protein CC78DRAFT_110846 [Didymosphaeria enalia]